MTYTFTAELWRYQGEAAWYFLTVPNDVSDDIEARQEGNRRGFGSVRVEVTSGATTWRTSLFPDSKAQAYVLPVKAAVRNAEGIDDGDQVELHLRLVDG